MPKHGSAKADKFGMRRSIMGNIYQTLVCQTARERNTNGKLQLSYGPYLGRHHEPP